MKKILLTLLISCSPFFLSAQQSVFVSSQENITEQIISFTLVKSRIPRIDKIELDLESQVFVIDKAKWNYSNNVDNLSFTIPLLPSGFLAAPIVRLYHRGRLVQSYYVEYKNYDKNNVLTCFYIQKKSPHFK